MEKEESSKISLSLHKALLYTIKVIPMLIAGITLLNTILEFLYIECRALSYAITILFLLFIYLASMAFKFCIYHRMFIHYASVIFILNVIDYEWGIPVSNKTLFILYIIITGIALFLILYFKRCKEH